jgi:hypothetical protein
MIGFNNDISDYPVIFPIPLDWIEVKTEDYELVISEQLLDCSSQLH